MRQPESSDSSRLRLSQLSGTRPVTDRWIVVDHTLVVAWHSSTVPLATTLLVAPGNASTRSPHHVDRAALRRKEQPGSPRACLDPANSDPPLWNAMKAGAPGGYAASRGKPAFTSHSKPATSRTLIEALASMRMEKSASMATAASRTVATPTNTAVMPGRELGTAASTGSGTIRGTRAHHPFRASAPPDARRLLSEAQKP